MRGYLARLNKERQLQASRNKHLHERAMKVEGKMRALEDAHMAAHGLPISLHYLSGWIYRKGESNYRYTVRLRALELDIVTAQLWAMVHERELDAPCDLC